MTDLRKAAEMALEALEAAVSSHGVMLLSDPPIDAWKHKRVDEKLWDSIKALRQALAQSEQSKTYAAEDITAVVEAMVTAFKLRREWVGLTDEEISQIWGCLPQTMDEEQDAINFGFAIEAKLKEKNSV